MKCERHPDVQDYSCVSGCPKCNEETYEDYKMLRESLKGPHILDYGSEGLDGLRIKERIKK